MNAWTPNAISDEALTLLIEELATYQKQGVVDPWLLSDGTTIEPLAVLQELQRYRQGCAGLNPAAYRSVVEALRTISKTNEATGYVRDIATQTLALAEGDTK